MTWQKHQLGLGTKVSFEGESKIFVTDCYTELLGPCPSDCTLDHDCYEEAYVCVRESMWTARPLSKLSHIFDQPDHSGRVPTLKERCPA